MKKVFIMMLVFVLIPCSVLAQDLSPVCKKHTFGLKAGFHWYPNSGFFNKWEISKDDFNNELFELEYEYKFRENLGFSIPFGINSSSESSVSTGDIPVKFQIKNFYIAPTAKFYKPINSNSVFAFVGGGFDISYIDAQLEAPDVNTSTKRKTDFGFHITLGFEWNIGKSTGENVYKWPVSLFIEDRYTWVEHEDIDNDFINGTRGINRVYQLDIKSSDIKTGGNIVIIGIKYHF